MSLMARRKKPAGDEAPRFVLDFLTLPCADWLDLENRAHLKQFIQTLSAAEPRRSLFIVAPRFMKGGIDELVGTIPVERYFMPLTKLLPARVYAQQTFLPLISRWKSSEVVISFGYSVPVVEAAYRLLMLLPNQRREWWRLLPALTAADAVTLDSAAQKFALESKIANARARIEVLPIAIDPKDQPYPRDATRDLLEYKGLKGRYFLVLGGTGSSPSQALVSLEAFSKIAHRPRLKSVQCVFMGETAASVQTLKKRAMDLGLDHRVRFEPLPPLDERPLWYSSALFAVASDSANGSPLALVRAMACGCPLILTAGAVLDARLKSAVFPCFGGDPKMLAEAMTKIVADSELRDSLVNEGLETAQAFSWERRVKEFTKICERPVVAPRVDEELVVSP